MMKTTTPTHTPSTISIQCRPLFEALLTYVLAQSTGGDDQPGSGARLPDRSAAARQLLAAVQALPELESACLAPCPPVDADKELAELEADVADLEWSEASTEIFALHAEEIAARARGLQEDQPALGRGCSAIIRRLTALAALRSIYVFGLARYHRANWRENAARVRAKRERLARPLVSEPQTQRSLVIFDDRKEESRAAEPAPELPVLRKAAELGAIAVVGGSGRGRIRDEVVRRAQIEVEWIETSGGGTRLVEPVTKRLRSGGIAALIVVEGAMHNRHSQPIIGAARSAGVPLAYAKKGGLTQILSALDGIERLLREKQAA